MEDIDNIIGNRIKLAREKEVLTQKEVANFLGYLSQSIISEIESGKKDISARDLLKLSRFLKVSINYLHGIDTQMIVANEENYNNKIKNVAPAIKETIDQLIQSDEIVKKNKKGLFSF